MRVALCHLCFSHLEWIPDWRGEWGTTRQFCRQLFSVINGGGGVGIWAPTFGLELQFFRHLGVKSTIPAGASVTKFVSIGYGCLRKLQSSSCVCLRGHHRRWSLNILGPTVAAWPSEALQERIDRPV